MLHTILKPLILALALCGLSFIAVAEDIGPEDVVKNAVNGIVEVLEARKDKTRLTEQDRDGIRAAVNQRFDYRKMARGSLGSQWKKLEENQKVEFTEVFRQLLERSYGNRLASYRGQKIEYDGAIYKKKRASVKSRVIDGDKETPVVYRLYQAKTGWKVYDIKIEGVSLVSTFRKDFKSILKKDGFDKLVTQLTEKVAKLKEKDQAS